jgi:hypothetical protein
MRDYVERADHDLWFRADVEQSVKEADDPNAEWVSHEEVVRKLQARRGKPIRKAERKRGRCGSSGCARQSATSESSSNISKNATHLLPTDLPTKS